MLGDFSIGASELPGHELIDSVLQANLGYLSLVTGDFAATDVHLSAAQALSAGDDEQAILHVAYYIHAQVVPDRIAHPRGFSPLLASVVANQVTLALARGQRLEAETLACQLASEYPSVWLGQAMVGWTHLTAGRAAEASEAWRQAFLLAEEATDRLVIEGWLASPPA